MLPVRVPWALTMNASAGSAYESDRLGAPNQAGWDVGGFPKTHGVVQMAARNALQERPAEHLTRLGGAIVCWKQSPAAGRRYHRLVSLPDINPSAFINPRLRRSKEARAVSSSAEPRVVPTRFRSGGQQ